MVARIFYIKEIARTVLSSAKKFYRQFVKKKIYNVEYGLNFVCMTNSDDYVYNEIFGTEDAYRRDDIIPRIKNGTVLEIGAHKGFFTLLAAAYANKVIAFEPDNVNFRYLRFNIELNKARNIIPVNKAVSDTEENKSFTVSDMTAARHTFFQSEFSGKGIKHQIDCMTLNSVFETYSLERIDLIKMDCEGSEYDIIYSADRSLFKKIDAIAMEIHEIDSIPHKKNDLLKYMEELGYDAEIYDERWLGSLHVWMALFTSGKSSFGSDISSA